jgi:hypothetical protein
MLISELQKILEDYKMKGGDKEITVGQKYHNGSTILVVAISTTNGTVVEDSVRKIVDIN